MHHAVKQENMDEFLKKSIFGFKNTTCQTTVVLDFHFIYPLKRRFLKLRSKGWGFLGRGKSDKIQGVEINLELDLG